MQPCQVNRKAEGKKENILLWMICFRAQLHVINSINTDCSYNGELKFHVVLLSGGGGAKTAF